MFYLFGTCVSETDGRYLRMALGSLGTPDALDAAEAIGRGVDGGRKIVPLAPAMQGAVCAALGDDPPAGLVELRTKLSRKVMLVKEW